MFNKSIGYNDENLEKAIKKIESFDAKFGTT